jgi:heme exporter protein D
MEKEKKEKLVQIAQIGTVVVYVFLILHSTVGEYVKLMKNIRKEAKRKDKLKKQKYAKKKRELKRRKKRQ